MTFNMTNKQVGKIVKEIGQMIELSGGNPFKAKAHFGAARTIEKLPEPVQDLIKSGTLSQVKGIGAAIEEKLKELVKAGEITEHNDLKASLPPGLFDVIKIPGLGTKKIRVMWKKLDITTLGELEYACLENRLATLEGFGEKSQQKILEGIEFIKTVSDQHLLHEASNEAQKILEILKNIDGIQRMEPVGRLRRRCETIQDLEFLIAAETSNHQVILDAIEKSVDINKLLTRTAVGIQLELASGFKAAFTLVADADFALTLFQLTGSREHVTMALSYKASPDISFNDHGLIQVKGLAQANSEESIYRSLELSYIPPEIRENLGEVEAAAEGTLPQLITRNDYKGVLHVHTHYSDGGSSLEDMVKGCIDKGFDYVGICDHSKTAVYANGLTEDRIRQQHEEIDTLQEKYTAIKIFKGIESDILADGSLDYSDDVLESFDLVVASVHFKLNMTLEEANERLENAVKNPFTSILGHPTGRLLLGRKGFPLDFERIFDAAKDNNVVIELNANPRRLDLDWRFCRLAISKGLKIAINPDAHSIPGLDDINYGIDIARKGWLQSKDVLNCFSADEFAAHCKNRRS